MKLPKVTEGARTLLFDRLNNREFPSVEPVHLRVLDRSGLKESVRQELSRLLNTRCPTPLDSVCEEERSVVNYGIPDFSSLSPSKTEDQKLLAAIITSTINAFEPRLKLVKVTVERFLESERALSVKIDAMLVVDSITEPVTFQVYLHGKSGDAKIEQIDQGSK
ncbi:MAG TPA: type VI secretion system baseplate subunit TssE [Blastocatellia bacterium]|nr:type VI secretion system baseplate subunit TssE [Blastocatellia bacterium]